MSAGLLSRSFGYLRSPPVGSVAGTLERTSVPLGLSGSTAFQPIRSGNVPSSTATVPRVTPAPVSGSSNRVSGSPPWPGGWLSAGVPGVSVSGFPSTVTFSRLATSASLRAITCAALRPALLERRDLRLVEDVEHVGRGRARCGPP